MKTFNESEIKYLAGLLDADGSLSFKFCSTTAGKTYLYLILGLHASTKVDRKGYILSLGERAGSVLHVLPAKPTHSPANVWRVQSRSDLNQLLPRLTKHMVIKGRHWNRLFQKYTEYKSVDITGKEEDFKSFSQDSSKDTGPLKPKKHPTWAWVAGYLDGDGCYTFSKKRQLHVGCIAHKDDTVGLQLLHKAFGGSIYEPQKDNTQLWRRGLGKNNKSFALKFLAKVRRHTRLKGWKIEQMISFHTSRND